MKSKCVDSSHKFVFHELPLCVNINNRFKTSVIFKTEFGKMSPILTKINEIIDFNLQTCTVNLIYIKIVEKNFHKFIFGGISDGDVTYNRVVIAKDSLAVLQNVPSITLITSGSVQTKIEEGK